MVVGGMGGVKNDPAFFASKINGLFRFLADKVFPGPNSMGFVRGGVGRALVQFMYFSAIFGTVAFSATSVTLWYPL